MGLHNQKKILITGGHLTPAIGVLEEFQNQGYNNLVWVGRKYTQTFSQSISAEYKIVSLDKKIQFMHLESGKIWRRWTIKTLWKGFINLALIPYGFLKSIMIIIFQQPDIVVSFGGYVALPIVIAAKFLGKHIVTHEQTLVSGLANKWIAKFADKIFVSWEQTMSNFPKSKTIFTGNPTPSTAYTVNSNVINFKRDLPILYITGGNQGANHINKRILPVLTKLLKSFNIIHQTGNSTLTGDYELAVSAKESLPTNIKDGYIVKDYIYQDEIGEVFDKADLILSRSGANTCTDILRMDKRAILIPIPWSYGEEQLKNARLLESIGSVKVHIQDDSMSPEGMYELIVSTLPVVQSGAGFDGSDAQIVAKKSNDLIKTDAAEVIVKEIISLMK